MHFQPGKFSARLNSLAFCTSCITLALQQAGVREDAVQDGSKMLR